jgi:serine/threonine protein kinase
VIASGSFGVVYQAQVVENQEQVAIKKVFQDKRYKNRELEMMKKLNHPCIVDLRHAFYTTGDKQDEIFLNLVMSYVPETVYRVVRQYYKKGASVPLVCVKLYSYQLMRALAYLHHLRFAIETSSRRICWWISSRTGCTSATSALPRSSCRASPT